MCLTPSNPPAHSPTLQRNDTPLILGLAAAFLGPAAIILAYASATGYLDTLYTSSLTLR